MTPRLLLIDTHILLWWLADSPRLSTRLREVIGETRNKVFVSSVSIAEMSIKVSLGKLRAPFDTVDAVRQSGFSLLPFEGEHAEELRTLPWNHRDPFDRMLIAQARCEDLTIVTEDSHFPQYDVRLFQLTT